jgi:hypothetical protein
MLRLASALVAFLVAAALLVVLVVNRGEPPKPDDAVRPSPQGQR